MPGSPAGGRWTDPGCAGRRAQLAVVRGPPHGIAEDVPGRVQVAHASGVAAGVGVVVAGGRRKAARTSSVVAPNDTPNTS